MCHLTRPTTKGVSQGSPASVLCIITLLCQSGGNGEPARAVRDLSRGNTRGRPYVVSVCFDSVLLMNISRLLVGEV